MSEIPRVPLREPVSDDEAKEAALKNMLQEREYTSGEFRAAYQRVCGVSDNAGAASERVVALEEYLQGMADNHFPLNRFAQLISKQELIEDIVPAYERMVEAFPVSAREKRMLRSLVREDRAGKLQCLVGKTVVGQKWLYQSPQTTPIQRAIQVGAILGAMIELAKQHPDFEKESYSFLFEEA